jgi:hypothetical protein
MSDPTLSRSGVTDPHGKMTCRLDIPVTEEMADAVGLMAAAHGIPRAEWVRRLLEREMFGSLRTIQRLAGIHLPPQRDQSTDVVTGGGR